MFENEGLIDSSLDFDTKENSFVLRDDQTCMIILARVSSPASRSNSEVLVCIVRLLLMLYYKDTSIV